MLVPDLEACGEEAEVSLPLYIVVGMMDDDTVTDSSIADSAADEHLDEKKQQDGNMFDEP